VTAGQALILVLGGLAAGFINTLAGGGSAITIPILTEMVGISPNRGGFEDPCGIWCPARSLAGNGLDRLAHIEASLWHLWLRLPAVDGEWLRCAVMAAIDIVWHRLIAYSGEAFQPEHGKSFTYSVSGDTVYLDSTDRDLSRSHFEKALTRMPLSHPVQLSDLAGASYIYTILTDSRIAGE
jgi:hypothetical protein